VREIHGEAKAIRKLLQGSRYAVDYYQRGYRWGAQAVEEPLSDPTEKFLDDYDAGHERTVVEGYGHYFLGSIILSDRDGRSKDGDAEASRHDNGPSAKEGVRLADHSKCQNASNPLSQRYLFACWVITVLPSDY